MAYQFTFKFQQKRDFGQVINGTFTFLRLVYKKMVTDLLLIVGPFFLIAGILAAISQNEMAQDIRFGKNTFGIEYFGSLFFHMVGFVIATAIVYNYVLAYKESDGQDLNRKRIMDRVKKDIFKITWTNIIYFLLVAFATVLLVIPGIYFSLALSLCVTIRVLNKETGLWDSIKESNRLLKGNWWRTFGIFFIISIIYWVCSMVLMIPAAITTMLVTFNSLQGGDDTYNVLNIICSAIGQVGTVLAIPIYYVAKAIYYYSLKEEMDADSLLSQIDAVGQTSSEKNDEGSY